MDKLKEYRFIPVVVIVLLVAGAGVFLYQRAHRQTPEYALSEIRTSLDKHDMKTFERYVDLNNVLESSYPGLMEGLIESETMMPDDAKNAMDDIIRMMKDPVLTNFKSNIEQYIATGKWTQEKNEKNEAAGTNEASELLRRSGLNQLEFRNIEGINPTDNKNTVIANILTYQHETGLEFVFEAVLSKDEEGLWRVTEIRNFKDFILAVSQARRAQLEKYMQTTAAIIEKHNKSVREAELKYGDILSSGSLGDQNTRDTLKRLMTDVIQKDWEQRKQELFTAEVPEAAQSLHHLRLRICDLHIEYAKGYALWMTDKKAATIRDADAKLKEAKTLEQEERILSGRTRMTNKN